MSSDNAAISVDSDNGRVVNNGELTSQNWGIYLTTNGASQSVISNSGSIFAWSGIGTNGTGDVEIVNYGHIECLNYVFSGSNTSQATIKNYGTRADCVQSDSD